MANDHDTSDRDQIVREGLHLIRQLATAARRDASPASVRALDALVTTAGDLFAAMGGRAVPVNGSHCTPLCDGCRQQLGGVHKGPRGGALWISRSRGSA